MITKQTKLKLSTLQQEYIALAHKHPEALIPLALSEIPEMVYNSNAIENSTLTLEDTLDILIRDQVRRDVSIREIYEAKNLAQVTERLVYSPNQPLSIKLILNLHQTLLHDINNNYAGRFRFDREWVKVDRHFGANPDFVPGLMRDLIKKYNSQIDKVYFLDNIAEFHAEFENIHPFCDGNGRIGRVLINQQLMHEGYPPIILRAKNKRKDYYPLFDQYYATGDASGFTELFALLLMESLHRRITILSGQRIIPLDIWAKKQKISTNSANNRARRQTIQAFRQDNQWRIRENYQLNS